MQAMVGQEVPFDRGREQMKILAGLEVTTKAVERTAEAIGADIAEGEQCEIRQAVQLDLPVIVGEPVPHPVCADGRDSSAGSEEGDGGTEGQDRQPAGPYARGQNWVNAQALRGSKTGVPRARPSPGTPAWPAARRPDYLMTGSIPRSSRAGCRTRSGWKGRP